MQHGDEDRETAAARCACFLHGRREGSFEAIQRFIGRIERKHVNNAGNRREVGPATTVCIVQLRRFPYACSGRSGVRTKAARLTPRDLGQS